MAKSSFNPGGQKGKLHRELGIPTSQKIPQGRLNSATHSTNPEIRRDAIRAKTMEGWDHTGPKGSSDQRSGVEQAMGSHADKVHPVKGR